MEWSQTKIIELLEAYENNDILWRRRHENYYNILKKEDAWKDLSQVLDVPKDECKKKIESLRGSYRREKGKARRVKTGSNKLYKSRWFAYGAMKFLDGKLSPRGTENNLNSDEEDAANGSNESPADPIASKRIKPLAKPLPNRKREAAIDGYGKDLTRPANSDCEFTRDECFSFGGYVENKLRRYDDRNRAIAQHRIANILFDIDMSMTDPSIDLTTAKSYSYNVQAPRANLIVRSNSPLPSPASHTSDSAQSHYSEFSEMEHLR